MSRDEGKRDSGPFGMVEYVGGDTHAGIVWGAQISCSYKFTTPFISDRVRILYSF